MKVIVIKSRLLMVALCTIFFLAGCGGTERDFDESGWDDQTEYVSVDFHLVWESAQEGSQGMISLAKPERHLLTEDLCTITVSVYDGSAANPLADKDFNYNDHHGTIKVKAGTNRRFVVEGKLCTTGEVVYRGEKSGVNLEVGKKNDAVIITMNLDTTPPQDPAISIDGGASTTPFTIIDLNLTAKDDCGVTGFYISESDDIPSISDDGWRAITPGSQKYFQDTVSYTLSNGNGDKRINVWFMDGAGNISGKAEYNINIVLPILLSPGNNSLTNNNQLSFDWADSGSAMEYDLQVDNNNDFSSSEINVTVTTSAYTPAKGLTDGQYSWRIRVKSVRGETSEWTLSPWKFTIDNIPPSLPIPLSPDNNSFTNNNKPSFNWADSEDAAEYNLQIDNNSDFSSPAIDTKITMTTYTLTTKLNDGEYFWRVNATDMAGNASGWISSQKITIDTTPPATTSTPAQGVYDEDITVELISDEPGYIFYTTDESLPSGNSTSYSHPISITSTTVLKFFAKDRAGNSESIKTKTYTIDKIPPDISINSPVHNSTVSGKVDISAQANDTISGISRIEFYYNDSFIAMVTSQPYSAKWDTTLLPDACYLLTAKGFDGAGNSATSSVISVNTYNSPALTVSPLSIDFGPDQTSKTLTISNTGAQGTTLNWTISIAQGDRQWLSTSQAQGSITRGIFTSNTSTIILTVNREGLKKGEYSGKITLTSNGGNKDASISMTVPNHSPEITSTCAESASIGVTYTCVVTASDPDNDSLTYSLITAPDDMVIDPDTGIILWTPTSWASYPVTISVSDSDVNGVVEQSFTISIYVSGNISSDATWRLANSPYIVTGDVVVENGADLTIEPGVLVKFNGNYTLTIDGTLRARGTETERITFSGDKWGYIMFTDSSKDATYNEGDYTGGSILEYCTIEKAGGATVDNNGAVRMKNSHPFINHCIIKNSLAPGICASDLSQTLKIAYSEITGNKGDGIIASGGEVIIADSNIIDNTGCGVLVQSSTASIEDNIVSGSANHGIHVQSAAATITNNTVTHNNSDGIHVDKKIGGQDSNVTIEYNTISYNTNTGNGGGIYTSSPSTITNNIINDNTASAGGGIYASSVVKISKNIVSDNTASGNGGGIYASSEVEITNNSIIRNSACDNSALYYLNGTKDIKYNEITSNITTCQRSSDRDCYDAGILGLRCTYYFNTVYIASHPLFNFNNIFANTTYQYDDNIGQHLYELRSSGNLNAENNWWGGGDVEGYGDVNPSQNSIICDYVPISPPSGFTNTGISGNAVNLTWSANPEGDTAGYKIYYDSTKVDSPYRYVKDVGKTTSYTLTLPEEGIYYITITACDDTAAGGEDDLFEGHESWYAKGISVTIGNK